MSENDCTETLNLPAELLPKYMVGENAHKAHEISRYVDIQCRGEEKIFSVELIKEEMVCGDEYEVWDVITDKDRWWVITNMTNLYSQKHFKSLDYTISFHIGLMRRLSERQSGQLPEDSQQFLEVFRKISQVHESYDRAKEAEDFQAIGMQLREVLVSLVQTMMTSVDLRRDIERPKLGDFKGWSRAITSTILPGEKNKRMRSYLRALSAECWDLLSWLTHHRSAGRVDATIALQATETIVNNYFFLLKMPEGADVGSCPECGSRKVGTFYDGDYGDEGLYYAVCDRCTWSTYPEPENHNG